jgi:acyl dehydratase
MANNRFQHKRTSTSGLLPNTTNSANNSYIAAGEFAVNLTDKKVIASDGTATFEVGANVTNQYLTGNITLATNGTKINFTANGTSAGNVSSFTLQTDNNFVFYQTATDGSQRAIWAAFTNSNTSPFSVVVPLKVASALQDGTGSNGTSGYVLTSNGTGVNWAAAAGGSFSNGTSYTWSAQQTYTANIALTSNTTSLMLSGASDNTWKLGRNIATYTKAYYTNNSMDFLIGSSSLEGITFGNIANTSFLEMGSAGNWFRANVAIGNVAWNSMLTVNGTVTFANSTANTVNIYANGQALIPNISTTNLTVANAISGNLTISSATSATVTQILSNYQIPPSGPFGSNAYLLTGGAGGNYLGFGQSNSTYGFSQWIQSGYTGSNTYYPINLNPLGGNVSIGSVTTPTATLTVTGTGSFSSNVSFGNATINAVMFSNATATYFTGTAYTANNATNLGGVSLSTLQTQITGNSATAYSNAVNYVANGVTNGTFVAANATYAANAGALGGVVASGYQTTAGLSANVATLTSNNTTYVNGKTEANLNVNSSVNATNANNAAYLGGTIASGYQTTAGLSANVATLTANNTTYVNGKTESNLNVNNAVTFNGYSWNAPAALGTTTANTGNFTTANASTLSVGTSFIANSTAVYVGNTVANVQIGGINVGGTPTALAGYGSSNSSVDITITNSNTGSNNSSDFAAYDTVGLTSPNFIDMGINGNTWSQSFWTINGPSDGYLYTGNTNLSIGTAGAAYINFFTGGTLAANERARFAANGNLGIATTSPAYKLDVTGDIRATANVYGTIATASQPNITANNSNYLGGTAASGYQTTAGLSANVATLTANNSTYLGGYTWTAPGAIGSGTSNTGTFTSLTSANVTTTTNTATFGSSGYFVANGNFGIGTSSPGYKLDVNGNIGFAGTIYDESNTAYYLKPSATSNLYNLTVNNILNSFLYGWTSTDSGTSSLLNTTADASMLVKGSSVIGDGLHIDMFAFNPPNTSETWNGTTWSTITNQSDCFIGSNAVRFGGNFNLTSPNTKIRFTWTSFPYCWWDALLVSGSTQGNTINATIEVSTDGISWTTKLNNVQGGSNWPGYLLWRNQKNNSGLTPYFRLTLSTSSISNTWSIHNISLLGQYGGLSNYGSRLFTWDSSKNIYPGGSIYTNNATYFAGKTSGGTQTRMLGINGSNDLYFGSVDASIGNIYFQNNTTLMTLNSSGNLGIGIVPAAKLHVAGTLRQSDVTASYGYTITTASAKTVKAGLSAGSYFAWQVNNSGSDGMTLDSSGRLMVNNTSSLSNGQVSSLASGVNNAFVGMPSANAYGVFNGLNATGTSTTYIDGSGNAYFAGYIYDYSNTSYYLKASSTSVFNNAQITTLGVGTAASGTTGEIRATNNITAYYSDRRLKDIEGKISNPLEKLKKLSGVYFTSNDIAATFGYVDKKRQVGVIAQEVESVLPEIVVPAPFDIDGKGNSISGENYKTVHYDKLVPLLIEAIKEQQTCINTLEDKINFILQKLEDK